MKSLMTIIFLMFPFFSWSKIEWMSANMNQLFIENKGQIIDQNNQLNTQVKFLGVANGFKVQLKANSFSYEVLNTERYQYQNPRYKSLKHSNKSSQLVDSMVIFTHRIDIELINANPNPEIIASEKSNNYLNYYTTGTPVEGVTFVHQYKKITYKDIYPNIDLEFITNSTNRSRPFKYNFIVRPNGNISDIKLKYNGAFDTRLMNEQVVIETAFGNLTEAIPQSYLIETGKDVSIKYYQCSENTFGFSPSAYPNTQTLLIDPWATYFGGANQDRGYSVATDKADNIIAVGQTNSLTNIATTGAHQSTNGGYNDAFICKFNKFGQLFWTTYYGGSDYDECTCASTDTFGNIIVAGNTASSNNIATPGAYRDTSSGGDSFIAKFLSSGIRLWGTYNFGNIRNLCTDISGDIILAGDASYITNFATPGAYQEISGGNNDGFIAKFSFSGSRQWCTYFGGQEYDECVGVSTDLSKNIIVTGFTYSSSNITTAGAYQTIKSTGSDAFLAKFSSSGAILWSSYYGGNSWDVGEFVSSDSDGNVIMTGETSSTNNIATPDTYKTTLIPADGNDAFIVKFDAVGNRLWGTYYGGNGNLSDMPQGIITDKNGSVILVGVTNSTNGIATAGSYQPIYGGNYDGFMVKFNSSGGQLWGSYFGGPQIDEIRGVALSSNGNFAIAGGTYSAINITTNGAYQMVYGGGIADAFIASFDSTGHITAIPFVNNTNINNLLQVYPNPTKDKIVVLLKSYTGKEGSLKLQTIEGKLLKQFSVNTEETSIDLKELAIGVYLLEYSDGEVCETVKVVKE